MKKIFLATFILATFVACSNTEKTVAYKDTVEVLESGSVYTKKGQTYNVIDDTLINGVVIFEDSYYDDVKIVKFKDGIAIEVKEVSVGFLEKSYTLNELGEVDGTFYYDDGSEVLEGTIKTRLLQGTLKISDYYLDGEKNYVNGILHGKSFTMEDDKMVIKYYNLGQPVPNEKGVEKVEEIKLDANPISIFNLNYEEGLYYEGDELYTGSAFSEYYTEYAYYNIKNGEVKSKFDYIEKNFGDYNGELPYLVPVSMTYYENNLIKRFNYNAFGEEGLFLSYEELDKDGNIHGKVIEFTWDGLKIEKEVYNGEIMGITTFYNPDGTIAEIHNYEEESFNVTAYYDYNNNIVKSVGGGVRNDEGFHKTDKWIWYYENGNIEQEVDYNLLDTYAYSKLYWENGKIKEEGKMTYDGFHYLGEVKKYNENGVLSSVDIYDTEGRGQLLRSESLK